ncbi:MAG: aldolase [Planctomycetes bacterium]|nr:aldolase [Planctomycetota bacterium]
MRQSVVKAKLARGEPVLVPCLHFVEPSLYELTSLLGFDCIWMDLEHHGYSVETATGLMRAARVGGTDIMARPAKGEFMRMSRLLEMGAQGIMYPRCESAEEAAEVVKWSKFAPLGRRGIDGANPDMPYLMMPLADYIREANEQTFVVIQIEDEQAANDAQRIAEVPGVDVLFLGPGDFSILGGFPGQYDHPRVQQAIETVARAARNAGKHWGMPSPSVDQTKRLLDMGARFIAHGADIVMMKRCLEQIQEQFGPLGFRFARQGVSGAGR